MSTPHILGLDHVVIAVRDLDAAITSYRSLGFTVQPGGRHPGRSSHNALIVFADGAYIELIAWLAPAPQERWWRQLQAHGDGYADFALLPSDTGEEADARAADADDARAGGRRHRNQRGETDDAHMHRIGHVGTQCHCGKSHDGDEKPHPNAG